MGKKGEEEGGEGRQSGEQMNRQCNLEEGHFYHECGGDILAGPQISG